MSKASQLRRIEQVKQHISENKKTYIACGVTAVVTAGVVSVGFVANPKGSQKIVNGLINWKSPNNSVNIQYMEVKGNRGNVVRCVETGKTFPSQNDAAFAMLLNAARLSEHLRGKRDQVGGFHFENLGENMASRKLQGL